MLFLLACTRGWRPAGGNVVSAESSLLDRWRRAVTDENDKSRCYIGNLPTSPVNLGQRFNHHNTSIPISISRFQVYLLSPFLSHLRDGASKEKEKKITSLQPEGPGMVVLAP